MSDACGVRVTGPLVPYVDGFRQELTRQGYRWTAGQLRLMAHVSRWLAGQGLAAGELTSARVEELVGSRRVEECAHPLSQRALMPLLAYLRSVGVVPAPAAVVTTTPLDLLLEDYRHFLVGERGLAAGTVIQYVRVARLFLSKCEQPDGLEVERLVAGDVTAFVVSECRRRGAQSAKGLVAGLRSVLRFLYARGLTARQLAPAVPAVAAWGGGSLPRALSPDQVVRLSASCDPSTATGRRDLAILTVLARLGLRAGEVAALELDDVDWRRGEIMIRGKGNRREALPLPVDVGEALVDYLRDGRPAVGCRSLFVGVRAPIGKLSPTAVGKIVRRSCERAGLPPVGSHRLRHCAATAMLRGGASLGEVGQVLRHSALATTAIYAKVDRVALQTLAQPWPGGAA